MYYVQGKRYADIGMWANAVLHYRRAAALEPTRSYYLGVLGRAYGELGYYQRSLDVLESAHKQERDPQKMEEWEGLIQHFKEQKDSEASKNSAGR